MVCRKQKNRYLCPSQVEGKLLSSLFTSNSIFTREISFMKRYPIYQCPPENNDCNQAKQLLHRVLGIVVHSNSINAPYLSRYVDAPEQLGDYDNRNHWNRPYVPNMVHAFIGLDKSDDVCIAQTLSYEYDCWGAGTGDKLNYLYSTPGYFEIMICEGGNNRDYFEKAVLGAAVQLCASLCSAYDLRTDQILSHREAIQVGYGSLFGDPQYWMSKYGKTMDDFRQAVERQRPTEERQLFLLSPTPLT